MILIALGSNLPSSAGTPLDTVKEALTALNTNGVRPVKVSKFYVTEAWPNPAEPAFVNAVAAVETTFSPVALLRVLHQIERAFGRERQARNAPRTLDLDLLDYEGRIEPGPPVLPHPAIQSRAFVLVPLREIVPEWRHPMTGKTPSEMIALLPDRGSGVKGTY